MSSAKSKKRLKVNKGNQNQGAKIKVSDTIELPNHKHPIFCFKHIQKAYSLDKCDNNEKKAFAETLVKYGAKNWLQISSSDRHHGGSEKIKIHTMKAAVPRFITDEVDHLIAIRFDGMKPIIGYKHKFIFHVLYIDPKMKAYNH